MTELITDYLMEHLLEIAKGNKGFNPYFLPDQQMKSDFWELWKLHKNQTGKLYEIYPNGKVRGYKKGKYTNYWFFFNQNSYTVKSNIPLRCQGCGKEDQPCCEIFLENNGCPS